MPRFTKVRPTGTGFHVKGRTRLGQKVDFRVKSMQTARRIQGAAASRQPNTRKRIREILIMDRVSS